jgi:hypothetical protein
MKVMSYIGLPVVDPKEELNLLPVEEVDEQLREFCYLLYDGEKYDYQVGCGWNNGYSICTTSEMIKAVHDKYVQNIINLDLFVSEDLKDHITIYCNMADIVPSWGYDKYYEEVAKGKTPRRLDGPHKGGQLGRADSRMVVLVNDDIIYGPTFNYLQNYLEKVGRE